MIREINPSLNKTQTKLIATASSVFVLLLLLLFFKPWTTIGAGQRGLVTTFGKVSDNILQPGLHWRNPFTQKIVVMDVRTVKHQVKALAYSKDIQTVDATVALNYHVDPSAVNTVFSNIGKDYEVRIIDPSIQESVKAATALFTAQDLIEQRPKVKDEIRAKLTERLNASHITVDDFSIVNFDFSDEYEKAVESKQVAQQSALKAENDLKRIKVEADQRVAQATAEAEAIKIQAEAITQQGGQSYVDLQAIQKWDGKLPQQFVPGSALPFINLTK